MKIKGGCYKLNIDKISIADSIMLKNISVRTFVLVYLVGVFLISNFLVAVSPGKFTLLIALNIFFIVAFYSYSPI